MYRRRLPPQPKGRGAIKPDLASPQWRHHLGVMTGIFLRTLELLPETRQSRRLKEEMRVWWEEHERQRRT